MIGLRIDRDCLGEGDRGAVDMVVLVVVVRDYWWKRVKSASYFFA